MTTLSLNEIRIRAAAFAKDFSDARRKNAESQIFWHEFFQVFGLPKRRVINFEHNVKKLGYKDVRIDDFWPVTWIVMKIARQGRRLVDTKRAKRAMYTYLKPNNDA